MDTEHFWNSVGCSLVAKVDVLTCRVSKLFFVTSDNERNATAQFQ